MILFLYNLFLLLITPVLVIRIIFKSFSDKDYRSNFLNRFGIYHSNNNSKPVWFHAVSLGEVISSSKIVEKILKDHDVVMSVTTPTGYREAKKIYGTRLELVYAPWDFFLFILGFFRAFNPKALILFETEIWPSMVSVSHSKNIPIILSNARMSEKSFKNYKNFSFISKTIIQKFTMIYTQSEAHLSRFNKLGASLEKIESVGSVKFDININYKEEVNKDNTRFILAASTHKGEDEIIIDAYKTLIKGNKNIGLVIAPRHPERSAAIKKLLDKSNLKNRILKDIPSDLGINNIDIMNGTGMLRELYSKAFFTFIGGSLFKENGGHNIIEAAVEKCPFIVGPHMYNFDDVLNLFLKEKACFQLNDSSDMFDAFKNLINSDTLRENISSKALDICINNQGSIDRQCKGILEKIK
jgi:3-deoxy-D-manno-octulosonic-acid transferase